MVPGCPNAPLARAPALLVNLFSIAEARREGRGFARVANLSAEHAGCLGAGCGVAPLNILSSGAFVLPEGERSLPRGRD